MSRTTVLIYAALFLSSLSIAEVAPANVFGESPSPREPAACPEANLHVLPVEEGKGRKPTAKEIATLKSSISDANLASFGGNNPGVWSEQAALLALLEGYKATKDTWFIDKLFEHYEALLQRRDDRLGLKDVYRKRVVKGWSTSKYSGGKRHVWAVHSGLLMYPVAAISRIVLADSTLRCGAYGPKASQYLTTIEEATAEFDEDWGSHNGATDRKHCRMI